MMGCLAEILTFPETSERFTLNNLSIPTQHLQDLTMVREVPFNLKRLKRKNPEAQANSIHYL